jgi:hypothetical protein
VGLVESVVTIHQVDRKHAEMLVEEVNVSVVDTFGNLLSDLVRRPALDHVEARPSVLCLGAGRGANEKVVLELSLEVVVLDVVCEGSRDLPEEMLSAPD